MLESLESHIYPLLQVAGPVTDILSEKICLTTKEAGSVATALIAYVMFQQRRADNMAERYIKRLEEIEANQRAS